MREERIMEKGGRAKKRLREKDCKKWKRERIRGREREIERESAREPDSIF